MGYINPETDLEDYRRLGEIRDTPPLPADYDPFAGSQQPFPVDPADFRDHLPSYRFLILDYLRRNGTATLEILCKHFNKSPHQLSGRLSELKAANLIEPTGKVTNGFAQYRLAGSKN